MKVITRHDEIQSVGRIFSRQTNNKHSLSCEVPPLVRWHDLDLGLINALIRVSVYKLSFSAKGTLIRTRRDERDFLQEMQEKK